MNHGRASFHPPGSHAGYAERGVGQYSVDRAFGRFRAIARRSVRRAQGIRQSNPERTGRSLCPGIQGLSIINPAISLVLRPGPFRHLFYTFYRRCHWIFPLQRCLSFGIYPRRPELDQTRTDARGPISRLQQGPGNFLHNSAPGHPTGPSRLRQRAHLSDKIFFPGLYGDLHRAYRGSKNPGLNVFQIHPGLFYCGDCLPHPGIHRHLDIECRGKPIEHTLDLKVRGYNANIASVRAMSIRVYFDITLDFLSLKLLFCHQKIIPKTLYYHSFSI